MMQITACIQFEWTQCSESKELKNLARVLKLVSTVGGAMFMVINLEKIDCEVCWGGPI